MTLVTKCPECGFESAAIRCPRCNALKLKGCDGVCSACAVSCADDAKRKDLADEEQVESR
jgi:hypothetical protein